MTVCINIYEETRNKLEIIVLCQKLATLQTESHFSSGLKILKNICMHLNIFWALVDLLLN